MNFTELLQRYGYLAVFVAAVLEGEPSVAAAAFAAHRGFLRLPWVMLAAFLGTFAGDQLYFFLGRLHSSFILARRPSWRSRMQRIWNLLGKYQDWLIFGFRFVYGIRTITPFVIGMSTVPTWRFVVICFFGALVWTASWTGIGYGVGNVSEAFLGHEIRRFEIPIFLGILFVGVCVWLAYRRRQKVQVTRPPN
ncbi:MAG: DedA family protein [Kiritimatiellae bacterium]|nr:DedA family protein [Kiritimatiellia bacterium]